MSAPDFDLLATEIEGDLRATIRDLLSDRCDVSGVTALYDGDRSIVDPLWKVVATELGLAGLLIPEELGGAGATAREVAAVLEELGRACAPAPFLTSSVIGASVLLRGSAEAALSLLRDVGAGALTVALTVPFSMGPGERLPDISVSERGITGMARSVAGAIEADVLLVPARDGDRVSIFAVEHAHLAPVSSLDMTRQVADIEFVESTGTLLMRDGEQAVRDALLVGAGLLASEQVGVARWCLEETVAYLKVRKQFGRVVGGFQALKHRLADLYAEVESASAAARYAAAAVVEGHDVSIAAHVAAAYASNVAVRAAEEAVQLHGGIGMTWEHPAHLYLKRAKADQIGLGAPGAHRAALAPLVDLV